MNYSVTSLTTIQDCDELLEIANLEQEDLDISKRQQERQYRSVTSGSSGVDAELTGLTAQVTALEAAYAIMPEGPAKQDMSDELTDLRHRKFLLEKRRRRYGNLALLQKEYAITSIEKQVAENASYIAAITQRKTELSV